MSDNVDIKKPKHDTDEDDFLDEDKFYKKYTKVLSTKYELHLDDAIMGSPLEVADFIHDLSSFQENDVVTILLNSRGGWADLGLLLARAIASCPAHTIVRVLQHCYSAGAVIALAGDYLEMAPASYLMFHNWHGGHFGKGGEQKLYAESWDTAFWMQCKDIVCPFLTQKEIARLQKDQDIYIQAPSMKAFSPKEHARNTGLRAELVKRMRRHFPAMKEVV